MRKDIHRRTFIRNASFATVGLTTLRLPGWAKELINGSGMLPPLHNIPSDKKLNPAWIKSLYERGKPSTYLKSKNELRYIGMPAGGLHTGTVYVGGDGRLWLWGIYNDTEEGIDPKTVLWNNGTRNVSVRSRDGSAYVEPAIARNKMLLEQGFAIRLKYKNKTIIKELKEEDWSEIAFEATYPTATIRFVDKKLPVEIEMKSGAIFIPLDADDSALPATVFSIHIKNNTTENIEVSVAGWLENGANKITAKEKDGTRRNKAVADETYRGVFSDFNAINNDATKQRDAGSTCIAFVGCNAIINTQAQLWPLSENIFTQKNEEIKEADVSEKLVGNITASHVLNPGKTEAFNYVISWHFDHPLSKRLDKLPEVKGSYYYASRFKNALEVMEYIANNFKKMYNTTQLWCKTYYDSTLPHWFLERTFLNIGTLATANTYRFANGRFWGWEGVNACEGTCTHV